MKDNLNPFSLALWFLLGSVVALGLAGVSGCRKTLEPGGAYAPATFTTNASGAITTNITVLPDLAFYTTDAGFRAAYSTVDAVFSWERDNRLFLWGVSPSIKHGLDAIRPTAVQVVKDYTAAREAYKASPTPAGLDTLRTVLAKMQQLQATATALSQQISTPPK